MSMEWLPEGAEDLSPKAKLVLKALEDADSADLSQRDLADEVTHLSIRAVRKALYELQEEGFVEEETHPPDPREKRYALTETPAR